jgi:hypothetical protein
VRAELLDGAFVIGAHCVERGVVGEGRVDGFGREAVLGEQGCVHRGVVRLHTAFVERAADEFVPTIDVGHRPTPQPRADAHLTEAVRPWAFPRVPLSGPEIDLLETEELPLDVEVDLRLHVAYPLRGLIRPGAHRVEVKFDPFHDPILAPARPRANGYGLRSWPSR